MAALNDWQIVDANNNATPPDGWPENTMQYSEVNDTGRAVQGTLKRFYADVNGSLSAGGVANAYTLTLNETGYTSYFDGMYFACKIPASNTGASTINVNSIGVQAIKARDGSDLTSGILDAGGIYEFRYDGVNFQLMGTLGGDVGVTQATITNSDSVDLVDTNVALRVGAVDPDTAQHIEVSPSEVQSKADATTASVLDLNPLGGKVNVGAQSGTGAVVLFNDGIAKLNTLLAGIEVSGNLNNDPTVGGVQDATFVFLNQGGTEIGRLSWNSTTDLRLYNEVHGGTITLSVEDAGGFLRNALRTVTDGIEVEGENNPALVTVFGKSTSTADVLLRNGSFGTKLQHDNQDFFIYQTSATGTIQNAYFGGIRNAEAILYYNGFGKLATENLGILVEGRIRVNQASDSGVLFERSGSPSYTLFTEDADDSFRLTDSTNADVIFAMDNNSIELYVADVKTTAATIGDWRVIGTAAQNSRFSWYDTGEAARHGFLQMSATIAELRGERNGQDIRISSTSTGAVLRTLIDADPDDDVALFDEGVEVARTLPAASGGFQVNNTSTGAGFERVLTTSDLVTLNRVNMALEAVTGDNIFGNSTTLFTLSGMSAVLRSDSQNDQFYGNWVTFADCAVAGNNPGLRLRADLSGSVTDGNGTLTSDRPTNQQVLAAPPDGTVIGINIGADCIVRYDFSFKPSTNSQTLSLQGGQSTADAVNDTEVLSGTNARVYDFDA